MDNILVLKKLGLTHYESELVLVLLRFGVLKATEICKKSNIPKNKVYESVGNLLKKGVVEEIPSTPKKYFINIETSFANLLTEKKQELNEIEEGLVELKRIEKDLISQDIKEPVRIIYGNKAFKNKIKEFTEMCKKENFILVTSIKEDPLYFRLAKEEINKGVRIKILHFNSNEKIVKDFLEIGVKIRRLKEPPKLIFSTIDNKTCRINLDLADKINDPTIIIENPIFVNILRDKFKTMWKIAHK